MTLEVTLDQPKSDLFVPGNDGPREGPVHALGRQVQTRTLRRSPPSPLFFPGAKGRPRRAAERRNRPREVRRDHTCVRPHTNPLVKDSTFRRRGRPRRGPPPRDDYRTTLKGVSFHPSGAPHPHPPFSSGQGSPRVSIVRKPSVTFKRLQSTRSEKLVLGPRHYPGTLSLDLLDKDGRGTGHPLYLSVCRCKLDVVSVRGPDSPRFLGLAPRLRVGVPSSSSRQRVFLRPPSPL